MKLGKLMIPILALAALTGFAKSGPVFASSTTPKPPGSTGGTSPPPVVPQGINTDGYFLHQLIKGPAMDVYFSGAGVGSSAIYRINADGSGCSHYTSFSSGAMFGAGINPGEYLFVVSTTIPGASSPSKAVAEELFRQAI